MYDKKYSHNNKNINFIFYCGRDKFLSEGLLILKFKKTRLQLPPPWVPSSGLQLDLTLSFIRYPEISFPVSSPTQPPLCPRAYSSTLGINQYTCLPSSTPVQPSSWRQPKVYLIKHLYIIAYPSSLKSY